MTTLFADPALDVRSPATVPVLTALTLDPASVQPDGDSIGTVKLDFIAPAGGTVVALASDDPKVQVPPEVTVPAGQYRASFQVLTDADAAGAVITATLGEVAEHATLTIGDTVAPETTIEEVKVNQAKRRAKLTFSSSELGSTFQCSIDSKPFSACESPSTYKRLKPGKHKFQVAASDDAGNEDTSAALERFKIRD